MLAETMQGPRVETAEERAEMVSFCISSAVEAVNSLVSMRGSEKILETCGRLYGRVRVSALYPQTGDSRTILWPLDPGSPRMSSQQYVKGNSHINQ